MTKKKAQEVYDKIMEEFPGLKNFMEESEQFARENGYVETVWGRKRRLPNLLLDPYEFKRVKLDKNSFNPLSDDDDDVDPTYIDPDTIEYYSRKLSSCYKFDMRIAIMQEAEQEGIQIKDNTKTIAEAKRQIVNSRVQGSAADQTKKAMIIIGRDEELARLGFRMLIPVHDEIVGEAPLENARAAGNRLSACMVEAAKDLVVPSKCDVEYSINWGGKEIVPEDYAKNEL